MGAPGIKEEPELAQFSWESLTQFRGKGTRVSRDLGSKEREQDSRGHVSS